MEFLSRLIISKLFFSYIFLRNQADNYNSKAKHCIVKYIILRNCQNLNSVTSLFFSPNKSNLTNPFLQFQGSQTEHRKQKKKKKKRILEYFFYRETISYEQTQFLEKIS